MNEHSVITNFYKQFVQLNSDKLKILRALMTYVLEAKPESRDYAMLNKLIKDFGYDVVFDALVSLRYSNMDQNKSVWGYMVSICKNSLKESNIETYDDLLISNTNNILKEMRKKMIVYG